MKNAFGVIPNLQAIMAESPEPLKAQQALWALFDQTRTAPHARTDVA